MASVQYVNHLVTIYVLKPGQMFLFRSGKLVVWCYVLYIRRPVALIKHILLCFSLQLSMS
jgi:hypothetical protein